MPSVNLGTPKKGEHTLQKETLEAEVESSFRELLEASRVFPDYGVTDNAYLLSDTEKNNLVIIIEAKSGYCYLEIDLTMRQKDRVGIFRFIEENDSTELSDIEKLRKALMKGIDEEVQDKLLELDPEMFGTESKGHAIQTLIKVFNSNEIRSKLISMSENIENQSLIIWKSLLTQVLSD